MNLRRTLLMAGSVIGLCVSLASAQQLQTNITRMGLKGDAAAVWAVIDREWGRSGCCGRENLTPGSRYLDLLTDDALVWYWGAPHPVDKASLRMSDEAIDQAKPAESKRISYELYPQGLVIHDNLAVAHYTCTVTVVKPNNETSTSSCRSTDILVRDRPGAEWKLISWVTGPYP
jgi:hypothetical protein